MRCAVIGGVNSTKILVERLQTAGFEDVKVWGYEPACSDNVSGWCNLKAVALSQSYSYSGFRKVTECHQELVEFSPDVLFVVGLSQIIPTEMLRIARFLNVGFHPTALPKGRGRAAIAWMLLEKVPGAATFFELQAGVDDGDILAQEPFDVDETDDATSLEQKILDAETRALHRWLPKLLEGKVSRLPQEHEKASWTGKRTPEDGWLDWNQSAVKLSTLIKASTKPHPGAYTFCEDTKLLIWSCDIFDRNEIGVPGRILLVNVDGSFVVQTGDGLILIKSWYSEKEWTPRVGLKLGYYLELENYTLRQRVRALEEKLGQLTELIKEKTS